MDPVAEKLAPSHGTVLPITAPTPDGIVVINLWDRAEGAAEFSRHPEALDAQPRPGLPAPSSFQRLERGRPHPLRPGARRARPEALAPAVGPAGRGPKQRSLPHVDDRHAQRLADVPLLAPSNETPLGTASPSHRRVP
ncbi:hypothetical protein GCM10027449_15330 [Sinomonas notoginsengisoli]